MSLAPARDTVYCVGVPPEVGAFQESLTPVLPLWALASKLFTGPGAPVVTEACAALPVPAALRAVTLKVYTVASLSPVIVAAVPETLAVPPPVTV